eukprot:jgi/Picre1/31983/NNA_007331.t1
MRSFIHNAYKNASEYILPPLSESRFEQKGVLTPEEFVEAGDFLVRNCPTFLGIGRRLKALVIFAEEQTVPDYTKNVPCFRRASAIESYQDEHRTNHTTLKRVMIICQAQAMPSILYTISIKVISAKMRKNAEDVSRYIEFGYRG